MASSCAATSNEARLALLERRMTGDLPSPRKISFVCGWQASGDPQRCNSVDYDLPPVEPPAPAPEPHSPRPGPSAAIPPSPANTEGPGPSSFGVVYVPRSADRVGPSSALGSPRQKRKGSPERCRQAPPVPGAASSPGTAARSAKRRPLQDMSPAAVQNVRDAPSPRQRTPQSAAASRQRNTLRNYFAPVPETGAAGSIVAATGPGLQRTTDAACQTAETGAERKREQCAQDAKRAAVLAQLRDLRADAAQWDAKCDVLRQELGAACASRDAALEEHHAAQEAAKGRRAAVRAELARLATAAGRAARARTAAANQADVGRLGALGAVRTGPLGLHEVWHEGSAGMALRCAAARLATDRDRVETARKELRKRVPLPEGAGPRTAPPGGETLAPQEYVAQDEILKARLAALRREEEGLGRDRERLDAERGEHVRELQRLRDEDGSRFGGFPTLAGRYLLTRLLGKGGFSEVFQAYDLEELQEVAVKVHQLNPGWQAARKESYVRHATREYTIHRALRHPRVVALLDCFEVDANTFATVLELCPGGDLESHLRRHRALPEREAAAVVAQVVDGLAYLNAPPHRIIHYDLKPANILFDALGRAKITDFGLSKVVSEGETRGLELTSQGAGTYWYLPPECFQTGPRPPLISSKVDVWAVGVVAFQVLTGRRPFGEGASQEAVLREGLVLNATAVAFPPKPGLSVEARDFITRCLAYKQEDRMDIQSTIAHPFLQLRRSRQHSATPGAKPQGQACANTGGGAATQGVCRITAGAH